MLPYFLKISHFLYIKKNYEANIKQIERNLMKLVNLAKAQI